ncbi:MAG: flagellar type III secretion system pore protein FliP [Clostridiales bacterium]|nr:flagellar type III secretion system pore protein FliP [Clostridiales bacterium]
MQDAVVNINGNSIQTLELIFLMTTISLLPFIVLMMTSFTRIIIVLSFTRNAMGVQSTPPNSVLIGIALFLTLFIMSPVVDQITENAYIPYKNEQITQTEAIERASQPLKEFMLKNTEQSSLDMYLDFAKVDQPENIQELSLKVVVPAFITSELKRALIMGFFIYIPFVIIDIIVSSTLMSMGMIMLPPAMISLPFKLLLFITVNGWQLLFSTLVQSFN